MRRFRFTIRTIMIAIAAIAVLMVLVRIALSNPVFVGVLLGILALFGPSVGLLLFPFVVDRLAAAQTRVASKFPSGADDRISGKPSGNYA
jgi:hypothetical protein